MSWIVSPRTEKSVPGTGQRCVRTSESLGQQGNWGRCSLSSSAGRRTARSGQAAMATVRSLLPVYCLSVERLWGTSTCARFTSAASSRGVASLARMKWSKAQMILLRSARTISWRLPLKPGVVGTEAGAVVLAALADMGLSYRQIQQLTGIPPSTAHRWANPPDQDE